MMKVLSIGQLPKEVGGNYTTGVANVVYELSKHNVEGVQQYLYASNIDNDVAKNLCHYPNQYMGYRKLYVKILKNILFHPIRTIAQWKHYKKVCHMNPLRLEFHRVNIEQAIKTIKPDIIHNHSSFVSSCFFANETYNVPMIRTYHGIVYKSDGDMKYKEVADEAIGTRTFADYYTALTEENALEVEKLGIPKSIIKIIPNGVDSSRFFFSKEDRIRLRKQYGAGDDTTVFMTVGRLIDRKGQLMFLKILEKLKLNYQYWLFGDGPDNEAICKYIKESNLEKRVIMFGQVRGDELYKYHSAADVYSHSSTTEGQSLAEIEAYSTGLRIVVNRMIAGTVIGDVHNDVLDYHVMNFDDVDVKAFKDWLCLPTSERMPRKSCDWSIIAQKYASLYCEILSK